MIRAIMLVTLLIHFLPCNALQVALKDGHMITLTADEINLLSEYSQTVRDDLQNQSSLINLPTIHKDIFLFLVNEVLPSLKNPKKVTALLDNFKKNHSVVEQENFLSLTKFLDIDVSGKQQSIDTKEPIFEITWPADSDLQKIYHAIFDASQTLKNYLADQKIERKPGNKIPVPGLTKSNWELLLVAAKQLKNLSQKPQLNDAERLSSRLSLNELAVLSKTADFLEIPILIDAIAHSIALRLHKKETLQEFYKKQNSLKEIIELLTPATQNAVQNILLNLIAQQRKISQKVRNPRISQNGKLVAGVTAKKILLWNTGNLEKEESISLFDEHTLTIGISPDGSHIAAYLPTSSEILVYNTISKKLTDSIKVNFVISQIEFSDDNKQIIATGKHTPIIFAELTDNLSQIKELSFSSSSYLYRDFENVLFSQLSFIPNKRDFIAFYLQRATEESAFILTQYVTGDGKKEVLTGDNLSKKFELTLNNPLIVFSRSQQVAAFITKEKLTLYSLATKKIDQLLLPVEKLNLVTSLALNQDASLLAIGYRDGQLELYSTQTKKLIMTLESLSGKIDFLQFSADNTLLVSSNGSIYLYDTTFANYFLRELTLSLAEIVLLEIYKLVTNKKAEAVFEKDRYLWDVFSALPDDIIIELPSWIEKK